MAHLGLRSKPEKYTATIPKDTGTGVKGSGSAICANTAVNAVNILLIVISRVVMAVSRQARASYSTHSQLFAVVK